MEVINYGLHFNDLVEEGNFLVLNKGKFILIEVLDELQIRMLRSNLNTRLLDIDINESDFKLKISYDIAAKRSLTNELKTTKLTLSDYYQLLLNIATVIEDNKKYSLVEQNYLLKEEFIYIGKDFNDLYLIYFPLKQVDEQIKVQQKFKNLLINLIGFVQEIRGEGLQLLASFCNNENFTISELKHLLAEVYDKEISKGQLNKQFRIKSIFTHIYSKIWRSKYRNITEINNEILNSKVLNPTDNENEKVPRVMTYETSVGEGDDNRFSGKTTFLSYANRESSDIHNVQTDFADPPVKFYLEVHHHNQIDQVRITNNPFIIGRSTSTVHYVEDVIGVSREHIEISNSENKYVVKDLGSKNGSYLNQEHMIPYKLYPLSEGDAITIVKTEFIFKTY